MDRRTQAERDAAYENSATTYSELSKRTPQHYNIRVTLQRDSMTVERVRLDGTLITGHNEQWEAEFFTHKAQHLMGDIIDAGFERSLHAVGHEYFVQRHDRYFNEVVIARGE